MTDFIARTDPATGRVCSVTLFGEELLDVSQPCAAELLVNGAPLRTRLYPRAGETFSDPDEYVRLKGERFVDHFTGWGLVISRSMGVRENMPQPCFGVSYVLRREAAEQIDLPCPGPGGPPIEAPMYVDSFTPLNWNWHLWGDDTRMIFPSAHSSGPHDEFGHVGYEHDTPEQCKRFMQNVWRRIYPGVMVLHGGVYYNAKTGHWLAITCRRPSVGYILNIENAGRGVTYDFTLHAPFQLGETLTLPEIKIYYGQTQQEMWQWMADYVAYYYQPTPAWVFKTHWMDGLGWNNAPSWTAQADAWEQKLATGEASGISYCLVTNRPLKSGTTPLGYEPDPNHGTLAEFKTMCRRITDQGVPLLIWMSHSGLMYRGGVGIDDDWFIRGIDGRICAAWGNEDYPAIAHINPGHPGYIEYTKKWIRFYMRECGAKGIFFDCLGWAFPADFTPRPFMRYPGDTNRMVIPFMEEIHACVKECDPEGIFFGEGSTFDAPIDMVSVNHNPVRAIDGWGPRDFLLHLNRYLTDKRIVLDQGAAYSAASGMSKTMTGPDAAAKNRLLTQLLQQHGGPHAVTAFPGDLGVLDAERLLIVPAREEDAQGFYPTITLSAPWQEISTLIEMNGARYERESSGVFRNIPAGIFRMYDKKEIR